MDFEPAWEEWAARLSAEIWEAVTLAHDVEPSRLPVVWRPLDDSDPFEEWPQLARDIRIATDHAGRKLKCVSFAGNPVRHKVDLSVFAEWWTASLGRKLPVRFPQLEPTATDQERSTGSDPVAQADANRSAKIDQLAEWIFLQRPRLVLFDKLYQAARQDDQLGSFRKEDLLAAYNQKVYITKAHRPPATGWPLRPEYSKRAAHKSS
jgi:hypothetical protein